MRGMMIAVKYSRKLDEEDDSSCRPFICLVDGTPWAQDDSSWPSLTPLSGRAASDDELSGQHLGSHDAQ